MNELNWMKIRTFSETVRISTINLMELDFNRKNPLKDRPDL